MGGGGDASGSASWAILFGLAAVFAVVAAMVVWWLEEISIGRQARVGDYQQDSIGLRENHPAGRKQGVDMP